MKTNEITASQILKILGARALAKHPDETIIARFRHLMSHNGFYRLLRLVRSEREKAATRRASK